VKTDQCALALLLLTVIGDVSHWWATAACWTWRRSL